ncbi:hypothetical protein OEIGOIKO_00096 [Streptomyces chrestomyceticus JCM 4735]|uniref:Transmembrane protein n=1 Tax=Streptomyces chrestomyceticus JCM 4735 TaxID=1306181 RepID=A0A7U9KN96_9ACTN|nr:hypothetical protein [Streptomyces chrestomyceticus]GCD32384.1 hypothetical protein OEIGOIKO_00096 [Streptomyces chrestomyceticus JCM 4735]
MYAPHFSENVWWVIAIVLTVLFLAVWLPMLPTPGSRYQVAAIPLVGVVFLMSMGKLRGHDIEQLLSMYSTGLLAFTIGVIGRRADLRIAVKQGEDPMGTPGSKAGPANKRLTVQMSVGIIVAFTLWAWLNWG